MRDDGEWMSCAEAYGVRRACEVEVGVVVVGGRQSRLQVGEASREGVFGAVDEDAHLAFLFGRDVAEVRHELVDETFLGEVFEP